MFKHVIGYDKLTPTQKKHFILTYENHYFHLGPQSKKLHDHDKIKEVTYNEKERCAVVSFEKRTYKYYWNRTWEEVL